MATWDNLQGMYVVVAFLFQIVLIVHFAVRRWRLALAVRYGPIVYALSVPAAVVSALLLRAGQPWWLWLGGFLYLVFAAFGYAVEYVARIQWRSPIRWPIFGPYIPLYLATVMFYWWPLALISKPLWYVAGALFVVGSALNVTSHHGPPKRTLAV